MSEKNTLECAFFAVIPYKILVDDTIPDAAKIFFGQLSGLSVKFGYCFACDEQLASMKKTNIRNVERWLKLLEDAGHIFRETYNDLIKNEDGTHRWVKRRKIHINHAYSPEMPIENLRKQRDSKKVCEPDKNGGSIEPDKNGGSIEPDKNGGYINKPLNVNSYNKPEAPSAVVVVDSLHQLDLLETHMHKISKEFSKEKVDILVRRTLAWEGRPSDTIGINTCIRDFDTWNDEPTKEQKVEINKKFLESQKHLDNTIIGKTRVMVGPTYMEFTAGMKCEVFKIEDIDFKKEVSEYIEWLNTLTK